MTDRGVDRERIARPVFIVGVPRSGTTLLYRTLLRHPSFRLARVNLSESGAVDALHGFVAPDAPAPASLVNYMAAEDVPADLRKAVARLRLRRAVIRRLTRGRWTSSATVWRLGGEAEIVRRYFWAAARSRGAKRLLEKTPAHLWRAEHLLSAFPDASFLCIHRHPVDVLSSYWRRFKLQGESESWTNVGVEDLGRLWSAGVLEADRLTASFPRAFRVLRYEDLLEDPVSNIRWILDGLDEPYDPICLEGFERQAERVRVGGERVTPTRSKTWRDMVSEEQAATLEELTAEAMNRLSYRPYSAAGLRKTLPSASLEEPQS